MSRPPRNPRRSYLSDGKSSVEETTTQARAFPTLNPCECSMLPKPRTFRRIVIIASFVLAAPTVMAQANPAWVDPPSSQPPLQAEPASGNQTELGDAAHQTRQDDPGIASFMHSAEPGKTTSDPAAPPRSVREPVHTATSSNRPGGRHQAARELAFAYLGLWSAPNRVALASASSFYGPTVIFHRQARTISSVLAEKRRFAERWPDRSYRYRPETTRVSCTSGGTQCMVRSIFDFSAANLRRGRRSLGIGEHELVVSFSGNRPVIASEDSRVLRRGADQRR